MAAFNTRSNRDEAQAAATDSAFNFLSESHKVTIEEKGEWPDNTYFEVTARRGLQKTIVRYNYLRLED